MELERNGNGARAPSGSVLEALGARPAATGAWGPAGGSASRCSCGSRWHRGGEEDGGGDGARADWRWRSSSSEQIGTRGPLTSHRGREQGDGSSALPAAEGRADFDLRPADLHVVCGASLPVAGC